MSSEANKRTVLRMWDALSARDWDALVRCLAPDVHYEDVASEDPGARGPENAVKRLRIAFDHLVDHQHEIHHIAAEGDVVLLDHTEVWTFKTGEKATNRFATCHEMSDGKISKWSDYWDVASFVKQFPQWFLEEMARHHASEFSGETPPSPLVAVHNSRPSGERSMPSGVLPGTGIAVTRHFGGPVEIASMTDTLFEPLFGTYIVFRSLLRTSMWVPSWPMPSIHSTLLAAGS